MEPVRPCMSREPWAEEGRWLSVDCGTDFLCVCFRCLTYEYHSISLATRFLRTRV